MKTMIKSIAAAALLMPCIAAADTLQQYVIERELPNAGQLTDQELRNISARSAEVLEELGPGIQWQHSYVVDDKIYCVYSTHDVNMIRDHGEIGGFPVTRISPVSSVLSPPGRP